MVTKHNPLAALKNPLEGIMTEEELNKKVREHMASTKTKTLEAHNIPIGSDGLVEVFLLNGAAHIQEVWKYVPPPAVWKKITADEAYTLLVSPTTEAKKYLLVFKARCEAEGDDGSMSFESILQRQKAALAQQVLRQEEDLRSKIRDEERWQRAQKQAAEDAAARRMKASLDAVAKEQKLLSKLLAKHGISPDLIPENAPQEVKDLAEKIKKAAQRKVDQKS